MEVLEKLVDYHHSKKLSHAYLIETNNINNCIDDLKNIIKRIFCEKEYSKNCNKCNICNLIDQNYLPSFIIVEPSGNTIKKEQVLELKKKFSSIPVYTKENIYIIKNAEKLTDASANTMLKFVEEPEDNIIGFFVTDNINNVITTIRSRCEVLKVKYDEQELNLNYLLETNDNMLNIALNYIEKLEVEKINGIMYNKDILISNGLEREDIKKIFSIMLIIYKELLNKLLGCEYNNILLKYNYFENVNVNLALKRINLIVGFLDNLNSNANIELLLDKFVIELSDSNE